MSDRALEELAGAAGILVQWEDYRGQPQTVSPDTLRTLLATLGLDADNAGALEESRQRLQQPGPGLPPLLTTRVGEATVLDHASLTPGARFSLELEQGRTLEGTLQAGGDGRCRMPAVAVPGYHRLQAGHLTTTLAVAPQRCYSVCDALADGSGGRGVADHPWGLAAQLYGLRAPGDGGLGTYAALGRMALHCAAGGADALAVSPVHAMFSADPGRSSPYSPSSRLFLNALHIDPRRVAGARAADAAAVSAGLDAALARAEAAPLLDWESAGRARIESLRTLWSALAEDSEQMLSFRQWRQAAGPALEDHARFEALHERHFAGPGSGWREFPPEFHDARAGAVADFAAAHAGEVAFHAFLQWQAAQALQQAQGDAREAGMRLGLIADLAIGSDPGGSHVWSRQHETLVGVTVGAPPDLLARQGQNWGLSALSPTALAESGFSAFIELLRASMRHAGGLRIDHVLGLHRLWLVPEGAGSNAGAYLRYPLQDLLRLVALESWRHRCIIIGEDLGTVPAGLREELDDHGVLGMSVLWFEGDDDGGFLPASRWRRDAVAMSSTHDLATLAGWWLGQDLELRIRLDLVPADRVEDELLEREQQRAALWRSIERGRDSAAPEQDDAGAARFVDAALAHVARTPAPLAVFPLEDVLGLHEQPNLPGTTDEHPNWRRHQAPGQWELGDARVRQRLDAIATQRRSVR